MTLVSGNMYTLKSQKVYGNRKKIVKMNKTHFPVLCTLIRLYYMFLDSWSSVTFDSFNRNVFDSVNANSSSQVSWKMQFAKNTVLRAIQFPINSFHIVNYASVWKFKKYRTWIFVLIINWKRTLKCHSFCAHSVI